MPGRPPAPLTDNAQGPEQGRPVSGFVPVVELPSSPELGSAGETESSDRAGKIVEFPLNTGLTVFPLSIGLRVFCAREASAVAMKIRTLGPTSLRRFAVMVDLPPLTPGSMSIIRLWKVPEGNA